MTTSRRASRIVTVGGENGLIAANHPPDLKKSLDHLSRASVKERGAVFTRRKVVEFILDLAGYSIDQQLHSMHLLEPSFGEGDFLLIAVERLLKAYSARKKIGRESKGELREAIRAVELNRGSFYRTKTKVIMLLRSFGLSMGDAVELADSWLVNGDFLLEEFQPNFSHVVGNPPYVRQELIPDDLIAEYRRRFSTIFDRADLYIPFIEKSLRSLAPLGSLGFICSDRWMKNRYGGPLRRMVSEQYRLKYYVDMVGTPTFQSNVTAYPAIFVITKEKPGSTRLAYRPEVNKASLSSMVDALRSEEKSTNQVNIKEIARITDGSQPWILESFEQLSLVRRLEAEFPTLEDAGCKVGIGVATGADNVFIQPYDDLDVEPDRKLPLGMTRDILNGTVQWRGYGVLNPFDEHGAVVDLDEYPKLMKYLKGNEGILRRRYVAKHNPNSWYRTIDRIYPELAARQKLLIPDIKNTANIVFEGGYLYPHHNLYHITSTEWDLRALQAVLMSGIARLFVSVYSVRMRGGYLRFQAQYLRRIRIPRWKDVSESTKNELVSCAKRGAWTECTSAVFELYGMSAEERAAFAGNGV